MIKGDNNREGRTQRKEKKEMKEIENLLARIKSGETTIEEGMEELKFLPIKSLHHTLIDTHRELRNGFTEVIYGEGKSLEHLVEIINAQKGKCNILVTRISQEVFDKLNEKIEGLEYNPLARTVTHISQKISYKDSTIGIITAGTSDIPVAEEAKVTCELFGNKTEMIYDVGVAGLHRLISRLEAIKKAKVLIVVAGMEGALVSVLGGLVSQPVIAVPTSVGYGASFEGLSALLGMLNSCASGITVVNIDNGFGAAIAAHRINQG